MRHLSTLEKQMRKIRLFLLLISIAVGASAQVSLESDFLRSSDFVNGHGVKLGKGSMQRLKFKGTLPVYHRTDSFGYQNAWLVSLSATQAWFHNEGKAVEYCPGSIINASLGVAHIRSISKRWYLLAQLGFGIYAPNSYIRFKSILAQGGAVFAYRVRDNFSVGVGGGLTNSYGAPMILPMFYLDWKYRGKVQLQLSLLAGITAKVSYKPSERLSVDVTAIEFDGMSAVSWIEGRNRLWSTMMLRSRAEVSYRLWRGLWGYAGLGVTYLRQTTVKDRKISNVIHTDKDERFRFRSAPMLTAGFRYQFTAQ